MGRGKNRAQGRPRDKLGRFIKETLPETHENNPLRTPVQAASRTPQLELSTNPGEPSSFPRSSFHIQDTVVRSRNRSRLFGLEQDSERILSEYEQERSSSPFEFSPDSQKSPITQPQAALIRGSTKIHQPALPYHWHPEFPNSPASNVPSAPQESSEATTAPPADTTAPPPENGRRDSPRVQTPVPSSLPASAYDDMEGGPSGAASAPGSAVPSQDQRREREWTPAYSLADQLFDAAVVYAVEQAIGIGLLPELRPAMSARISQRAQALMG